MQHARHPHRRRAAQRDGDARRVRRVDEPDPAPAGDRARRRPAPADRCATGPRSTAGAAPRRCAAERSRGIIRRCRSSWPAACPRSCCTCAAPACSRPSALTVSGHDARRAARSSGSRPSAARGCAQLLRDRDGVDPDDVIMSPETRPRARADVDGLLPDRQPRAGRRGDQEHGDRSVGRRCRRRLSVHRAGARCSSPSRRRWPPSRTGAFSAGDVLVLICRGPMGAGMEETYQLTSALQVSAVRQARGDPHRRALQRRVDRRLHRPRVARSAGRRPDRQAARRRPDRDRHRSQSGSKASVDFVGEDGVRGRSPRPAPRSSRARPLATGPRAPIPRCPTTRGCGPRCRTRAAAPWGGSVFDVDAILARADAGRKALQS